MPQLTHMHSCEIHTELCFYTHSYTENQTGFSLERFQNIKNFCHFSSLETSSVTEFTELVIRDFTIQMKGERTNVNNDTCNLLFLHAQESLQHLEFKISS